MSSESIEKVTEVNLGFELQKAIGGQYQYLVRCFDQDLCKKENRTFLGEGLKISGDAGNYDRMKINPKDLVIAIERLEKEIGNATNKGESVVKSEIDSLPPWAK